MNIWVINLYQNLEAYFRKYMSEVGLYQYFVFVPIVRACERERTADSVFNSHRDYCVLSLWSTMFPLSAHAI